jgi:predicted small metal-binding protein
MPSIKCADIGMDCTFAVNDDNREKMLQVLLLHAEKTHNMKVIPPDIMHKIQKAIKK